MSENERKKYVPGFNIYEQENISDTFYSDNNLSSDIFSENNAIYEDSSNLKKMKNIVIMKLLMRKNFLIILLIFLNF